MLKTGIAALAADRLLTEYCGFEKTNERNYVFAKTVLAAVMSAVELEGKYPIYYAASLAKHLYFAGAVGDIADIRPRLVAENVAAVQRVALAAEENFLAAEAGGYV